jgi:hypothetical protein
VSMTGAIDQVEVIMSAPRRRGWSAEGGDGLEDLRAGDVGVAGGSASTKKPANATRCPRITSSSNSSTNISPQPVATTTARLPLPLGDRQDRKTGRLTENAMHRINAYNMVRWRTADTGSRTSSAATCSATEILEAGVALETAQAMAAHEDLRTTKLTIYQRRDHAG